MDDYQQMADHAIVEMQKAAIHYAEEAKKAERRASDYRKTRDNYIRSLHEVRYSARQIAALLGMSSGTIGAIIAPRKDEQ